MENQNADVRIVLEEMRRQFDMGLRTGELLDQKAGAFLVAAGAVIILAMGQQTGASPWWALMLTGLVAVSYVVAVVLALVAIRTSTYKAQISTDWHDLEQRLFNEIERNATLVMISTYIETIEHNRAQNDRKASLVDRGLAVSSATIIVTMVLVMVT